MSSDPDCFVNAVLDPSLGSYSLTNGTTATVLREFPLRSAKGADARSQDREGNPLLFVRLMHNRLMHPAQPTSENSLYQRIGGYDVIASVIDNLFELLRADSRFARFVSGRSVDSFLRARQLLVDQVCSLAGGPCFYIGRDMKTSHTGLGITEEEWQLNLQYTKDALKTHSVGDRETAEFLELFKRYKDDIVEAPNGPGL
jgi:hemoglobin